LGFLRLPWWSEYGMLLEFGGGVEEMETRWKKGF